MTVALTNDRHAGLAGGFGGLFVVVSTPWQPVYSGVAYQCRFWVGYFTLCSYGSLVLFSDADVAYILQECSLRRRQQAHERWVE